MLIAPTLPTVAELVDRALADTAFLDEITADEPHELRICVELAAERAAEAWERAAGLPIASTLSSTLTDQVAHALLRQSKSLRKAGQCTLSGDRAMVERSIADLATLRRSIRRSLPLTAAEALMSDIERQLDSIRLALHHALAGLDAAIEAAAVPSRPETV